MQRPAAGIIEGYTPTALGAYQVLFSATWTSWGQPELNATVDFDGTRWRQISRYRRCPKSKGGAERKHREHVRAHWISPRLVVACWSENRLAFFCRQSTQGARGRYEGSTPSPKAHWPEEWELAPVSFPESI